MSRFSVTRTHIPEAQIQQQLWFYQLMFDTLQADVARIETELLAFQFRYQSSVHQEAAHPDPPLVRKKNHGILQQKFRQLALLIHPDHAMHAQDLERRTELLAQASAAVEAEDLEKLIEMLSLYKPVLLEDIEAILALKFRIHILYSKRVSIMNSDSWSLYQLELEWADQGRDLLKYLKRHGI